MDKELKELTIGGGILVVALFCLVRLWLPAQYFYVVQCRTDENKIMNFSGVLELRYIISPDAKRAHRWVRVNMTEDGCIDEYFTANLTRLR